MSAQGHYHQVRVLQSQILNPGQWDFQVCSGSVGTQRALEKRWLLLWWCGPCCGPQRMIMWPPKGPEARNKINAHSIPGSASAPGASLAWEQVGCEWAMHQVRNSTMTQGSMAPSACQLQVPHPQGSVLSLPKHSTCWMVPGTLVITPDLLKTLLWLLSPWAIGSVPP